MSDEENGEDLGERVTMPFKFVTGTSIDFARYELQQANLEQLVRQTTFYCHTMASAASNVLLKLLLTCHHSRFRCPLSEPKSVCYNVSYDQVAYGRADKSNRTKHCWQNYVDYHKCVNARGEDFAPCRQVRHIHVLMQKRLVTDRKQFLIAFRSLCPAAWIQRWDDQRGKSILWTTILPRLIDRAEKGIFPARLDA